MTKSGINTVDDNLILRYAIRQGPDEENFHELGSWVPRLEIELGLVVERTEDLVIERTFCEVVEEMQTRRDNSKMWRKEGGRISYSRSCVVRVCSASKEWEHR